MGHDDDRRTALEGARVQPAPAHAAQPAYRLRSNPGVGKRLALGRRDALPDSRRCPRVQACVSSGRLVTWAHESAGTRDGTAGQQSGHADRTWAGSAAAGLVWRNHPAGHQDLARLERTHGEGKALTVLAQPSARAVSDMVTRDSAGALDTWFHACWSGAGEPAAARAAEGSSRPSACR
jgi:hypothetical protein